MTSSSNTRIPELDGIRGVAICLVLVWHFLVCQLHTQVGTWPAYAQKALGLTWAGVDLFFVLSGFLIGGILMDQRNSDGFFKIFYLRRICRILPSYFVLLLASFVFFQLSGGTDNMATITPAPEDRPLFPWVTYPLFLQNFWMASTGSFGAFPVGQTWSLAVEEQFYLLAPLVVSCIPVRSLARVLMVAAVVGIVFRLFVGLVWVNGGFAAYVLLPCRWDALITGVLCAWLLRQPRYQWLLNHRSTIPCLWVLTGICLAVLAFLLEMGQGNSSVGMACGGYTIIACVAAAIILLSVISGEETPIRRLLRSLSLCYMGKLSYFIYLWHVLVNQIVHVALLKQEPVIRSAKDFYVTVFGFLLTIGLASLSWHWFENPIIRFGHKFTYVPRQNVRGAVSRAVG